MDLYNFIMIGVLMPSSLAQVLAGLVNSKYVFQSFYPTVP